MREKLIIIIFLLIYFREDETKPGNNKGFFSKVPSGVSVYEHKYK